jgi:hypothetical protein
MGIAGEDARFGLAHHLLHARHHALQLPAQPVQRGLLGMSAARLTPSPISLAKRFACPTTRPVDSSNLR